MTKYSRAKFDVSKITGFYPLMGAFLIVVEGLLGFWIWRAGGETERIVAGILMTIIFCVFLYIVLRIAKKEGTEPETQIKPQGFDDAINPAETQAMPEEINQPEPEKIASNDRSYIINRPPDTWSIKEPSFGEWVADGVGITDEQVRQNVIEQSDQEANFISTVLCFQSDKQLSIMPIVGKTSIDQRMFPTALATESTTKLSIFTMEKALPPLYTERPLIHNFISFLTGILQIGVLTLHNFSSGFIKAGKRKFYTAEMHQNLLNVIVNDDEVDQIAVNVTILAIEGELKDYILIMNYASTEKVNLMLEEERIIIQNMVNSFRPLKITDPQKIKDELKTKADESFKFVIENNGEDIFYAELNMLMLRLLNKDMNVPSERIEVIRFLKPFKIFADTIGLEDQRVSDLFQYLGDAEKGEAHEFKEQFKKLIEEGPLSSSPPDNDTPPELNLIYQDLAAIAILMREKDLEQQEVIEDAIQQFKAVKQKFDELNLQDEDLDEVWLHLDAAENGETEAFVNDLRDLIDEITNISSNGD